MAKDWKWYASRDAETYTVGPCDSREQVIEAARVDLDGERFHIMEAYKGTFKKWLLSADRILELMTESADEDGCCGDDYAELSGDVKAAEDDLNALLDAWFERHVEIFPKPWLFTETRNEEWIEPESAEAAA